MISVICCYNNRRIYEETLLKSFSNQTETCEMIPVDNSNNQFDSAAKALNYGASLSHGDYLIFAHQDIEIYEKTFVTSLINHLKNLHPAIIGVAGRSEVDSLVHSNITDSDKRIPAGGIRIDEPSVVQTLDECLIALERNVFDKYLFDEKTCSNWHLYTVDLCLSAGMDNIKSYVIPVDAHHKSSGKISKEYYKTLVKLIKKHRKNVTKIYSTCSVVSTKYAQYTIFRLHGTTKSILRKLIKSF